MSEFTAIRAASVTLQTLLEREITRSDNPSLAGVPVHLNSPRFMRESKKKGISLWLYMITREPDTLNRRVERPTASQVRRRPLPLTLHYLICPLWDDPRDDQTLLGKIIQVFHDHAVLTAGDLRESLAGADELRLVLDAPSLQELSLVWESLNEPYHLSVSYTVQVVDIDSDTDDVIAPPVLVSTQQPAQIIGGGAA